MGGWPGLPGQSPSCTTCELTFSTSENSHEDIFFFQNFGLDGQGPVRVLAVQPAHHLPVLPAAVQGSPVGYVDLLAYQHVQVIQHCQSPTSQPLLLCGVSPADQKGLIIALSGLGLIFLSPVPEVPRSRRLPSSVLPGNLRVVTGEVLVDHVGLSIDVVCHLVGVLPVHPGRFLLSRFRAQ